MTIIEDRSFDAEREFYGAEGVTVRGCTFDGPADGESAFKESRDITAEGCLFNLRYPFWHAKNVTVRDSLLTPLCRAALWYTDGISVSDTKMHGIKALRECADVSIEHSDIVSPEFGWLCRGVSMTDTEAEGEYMMMRSDTLRFERVRMKGKYSFQYISDSTFEDCVFDTKDAFWHARGVTVRNSVVKGEYLGWYSENLTLENCIITGTQPLCYCKGLRLIDCEMHDADLSFEKSEVWADITTHVDSIKNPTDGRITVPTVGRIIRDDEGAKCRILVTAEK